MFNPEFIRQRALASTLLPRDVAFLIDAFKERTPPAALFDLLLGMGDILTQDGASKLVHALLIQQADAPFHGSELSFKGRGREHVIFKVGNKAVKVAQASWGFNDIVSLLELAEKKRQEYEELQKRYATLPKLLLPGELIIGRLPPNNKISLAVIQPWLDSIHCVFDKKTLPMFHHHGALDTLCEQLKRFAQITLHHYENGNGAPDLVGPKNLSIDKSSGHLILLDCYEVKRPSVEPEHFLSEKFKIRHQMLVDFVNNNFRSIGA